MPSGRLYESAPLEAVRSRVGESLTQLHGSLHEVQKQQREVDGRFVHWQQRVAMHGRRIAAHLERIERELVGSPPVEDDRPSLSVVGLPIEFEPTVGFEPC